MNFIESGRAYIKSKFFGMPFYAHFYITRRCNLRCPMCNIPLAASGDKDLSLDEINTLAEQLRKIGLSILVLTGGEPFLRADIPEIIGLFTKQGIAVRAQTNGLLASADILDKCFQSGLEFLTVSLDSLDKNMFDEFCGKTGVWQGAVDAMQHAVLRKPGTLHIVNTVVSRFNIDELPAIARFVDKLGAFSSFVPIHINIAGGSAQNLIRSGDTNWLFTDADKPRIEKSYSELIALKKNGARIGSSLKYLEDSSAYLAGASQEWRCDAGKYYMVIFPNGDLSVCDEFAGLDTARGKKIEKVFRSDEFAKYRCNAVSGCKGCIWGCWRETSYLLRNADIFFERVRNYFKVTS